MNKTAAIGLDKIYLHHSVYPNKTTMIQCDGHHNSSGRNGSGKTTLQKLIPIFYGENVSKVVPAMGTKDPFIQYYLKSEASFIAFEYTNPSGKCCVVFHKKKDHLHYRFMKGALTDFFFTVATKEKLQRGKPIHEFVKDLKAEGHPISQNVSTTSDYRAILQNDKNLLRTRRQAFKNILDLARDYSLPGFTSNMQLMHKLTYALQTRTSMFSGLEDMIVSTQFDFVAPEKPKHVDNKSLTDDLKSLHDFAGNEEKIRQSIKRSNQRLQAELETLHLGRKLTLVYDEKLLETDELKFKIDSLEKEYQIAKEKHDDDISEFNQKLSKTESDNKNLERQINTIHEDKDDWDNTKNIQFKKNQYGQIDILKAQYQEAEEHYQTLTDGISAEKAAFDRKQTNIKEETAEKKSKLNQQIDALKKALNEYKENISQQKQVARDDKDKVITEKEIEYRPKREGLIKQLSASKERAKSASNTEEELAEYELAEQQLHEALNKEELLKTEADEAKQSFEQKNVIYKEDEQALQDIKQKLTDVREKERKIHRQRFPDNKSLISFLRKEKPDWAETVGKVISADLLHDVNLEPVNEESLETLYGISLNLSKLAIPEHASNEETLSQLHKQAEDEVERIESYVEKKESELIKLLQLVKELEQLQQNAEQAYKQAKNTKGAAQSKLDRVRAENKYQRSERAAEARKDVTRLENNIESLQEAYHESLEQIEDDYRNYVNELQGLVGAKESEIQSSIDSIQEKKTELDIDSKQRISEIKKAFKQACEEKGLDESIELAAKKRFNDAKRTYKAAENSIVEIQEYEAWVKNQWNVLPELETQFNKNNQRISQLRVDIEESKTQIRNLKQQTISKVKVLKNTKKQLNELLLDAKLVLDELGVVDTGKDHSEEDDFFKLIELLRSELKDYKRLTNETLKDVRRAQGLIEKRQESRIFEQWMNIYRPYEASSQYEDYDDAFLLNLPPLFEDLLDNHLPQIRQSTLEAIIGVSGQIDNYYKELKNISSEISTVSTRLSNQIKTNQQIDALSEISIRLVSKVEEIGAWQEMESFHKVWAKYSTSVGRELPPEDLGDALSAVVEALEYAHAKPDLKSMISLVVTLKENGNYKEVNSDKAMNDTSSNGLSLLAVIAIYIGMSRYLCPDPNVSLTWPVDELSTIDLENISSLFNMLDKANIRLFSAFPTKEHNILKHFDICHELDFKKGAMIMKNELPDIDNLTDKLTASA